MTEGKEQVSKSPQRNNILAANIVADTIRTTLGPKGMDKLLVNSVGDVTVTNDGATILREMALQHPVAQMIVDVALTQEQEVGDGTTSAVLFAGSLLKHAESLLDKHIHPTVIIQGYTAALDSALQFLESYEQKVTAQDTHVLEAIARTAMTGKTAALAQKVLAPLCVQAMQGNPKAQVRIHSVVGKHTNASQLLSGLVIDKTRVHTTMPKVQDSAVIALLNVGLELKAPESSATINLANAAEMQHLLEQEEQQLRTLIDSLTQAGVTAVFNQKGIDELAQHYLAAAGIFAVRRVRKDDMNALSAITGGAIVSSLRDLTSSLGKASIRQENLGEDVTVVTKQDSEVQTLVVYGSTPHVAAEMQRSLEDALGDISATLDSQKAVPGAGAVDVALARHVRSIAHNFSGKVQLAVQAFADSIEVIPLVLAENAGLDALDVLTQLYAQQGPSGVSAEGNIIDAWQQGIIEPAAVKRKALQSAVDVAMTILRIDDIIASTPPESMPPDMEQY